MITEWALFSLCTRSCPFKFILRFNPLPTIKKQLREAEKVLTPSIKPPYKLLWAYGSSWRMYASLVGKGLTLGVSTLYVAFCYFWLFTMIIWWRDNENNNTKDYNLFFCIEWGQRLQLCLCGWLHRFYLWYQYWRLRIWPLPERGNLHGMLHSHMFDHMSSQDLDTSMVHWSHDWSHDLTWLSYKHSTLITCYTTWLLASTLPTGWCCQLYLCLCGRLHRRRLRQWSWWVRLWPMPQWRDMHGMTDTYSDKGT